jgi:hypothetical protein
MNNFPVVLLQCANQTISKPCKLEGMFACQNCKLVSVSYETSHKKIFNTDTHSVLWTSLPKASLEQPQDRMQGSSQQDELDPQLGPCQSNTSMGDW